jgi:hypothetical protein
LAAFGVQQQKRIEQLITEGTTSFQSDLEQVANPSDIARCKGYVSAGLAAVEACCPPAHAYVREARAIAENAKTSGYAVHMRMFEIAELLKRLRADIADGLLVDLESVIVAEAFDDFLDHAVAYERANRKSEAGVVAGVVFEDTIRRICRKNQIQEKGRSLEDLLNDLNKATLLTGTKTKRAKSAAHVRTKATHAQWDEFDMSDVRTTIELTRELLDKHMQ